MDSTSVHMFIYIEYIEDVLYIYKIIGQYVEYIYLYNIYIYIYRILYKIYTGNILSLYIYILEKNIFI